MKKAILIKEIAGEFAENKDKARDLRLKELMPLLERGEEIFLDFTGVTSMTQSFCHALISDIIRVFGIGVLDRIEFAHCEPRVRKIIEIVVDYMQ